MVNFLWGENVGQNWNESLSYNNSFDNDLTIFPNPTNGILNFTEELQNEKIEIFSLTGQKIFDREVTNINSIRLNLNSGIYLLKVSNNHRVINSKIIIK